MDILGSLRWKKDAYEDDPPTHNFKPAPPRTAVMQRPRQIDAEVAAVLSEFADLREARDRANADRDTVKAEYDRAMELVTNAKNHIVRLQEANAEIKARCSAYQLERDEAVAKFARLDSLIKSIKAMIDAHGVTGYDREPVSQDAESTTPAPDNSSPHPPSHEEIIARINGR